MNLINYQSALNILKSGLPIIFQTDTLHAIGCLPKFAKICTKLVGDYLELGTYEGHTAQVLTEKIDFNRLEKDYFFRIAQVHNQKNFAWFFITRSS